MKDYANIDTSHRDDFNWGDAIASALLLPVLLIELFCFYVAFAS